MTYRLNVRYVLRFAAFLAASGIVIGLLGMLLSFFLFEVQHLSFGYSYDSIISGETYLEGVRHASFLRRVLVLTVCGLLAGGGWYLLFRYGKKLVGISEAADNSDLPMPPVETTSNVLLQMATIGMGMPLGKEGAPREIGALFSGILARWGKLDDSDVRLLIAAGAGAGLAAVYNAPLGGAFFSLGLMSQSSSANVFKRWSTAFILSGIAAFVARLGLGDVHQYFVSSSLRITSGLLCWAVLAGPLLAVAAHYFVRLADHSRKNAPKDGRLLPFCLIAFVLLGLAMGFLPELAGNGRIAAQIAFSGMASMRFVGVLLVCKIFFEWASLRAGATGGLLTPGLSNGAMLSLLLGYLWNLAMPGSLGGTFAGAFALVGGAAFLAVSTRMPLMALALVMEMTQVDRVFLLPLALCIASAWGTQHCLFSSKPVVLAH